ncbi:hypothetical protein BC567DRAFT_223944 [Phyllosticta citribraziliensis]
MLPFTFSSSGSLRLRHLHGVLRTDVGNGAGRTGTIVNGTGLHDITNNNNNGDDGGHDTSVTAATQATRQASREERKPQDHTYTTSHSTPPHSPCFIVCFEEPTLESYNGLCPLRFKQEWSGVTFWERSGRLCGRAGGAINGSCRFSPKYHTYRRGRCYLNLSALSSALQSNLCVACLMFSCLCLYPHSHDRRY